MISVKADSEEQITPVLSLYGRSTQRLGLEYFRVRTVMTLIWHPESLVIVRSEPFVAQLLLKISY